MTVNAYSARWRATFTPDAARTLAEAEFLERRLPLPGFRRVLDVCCGQGRHALALANAGYRVTGVDRDAAALELAARRAPEAEFHLLDVRDLASLEGEFDAAVSLGQSFGFFDDAGNAAELRAVAGLLRPGGRAVLDVFDRRFLESSPEPRAFPGELHETRELSGGRLHVRLEYPGGDRDEFDWRVYDPDELGGLAAGAGLRPLLACTAFDERHPATGGEPRFQLVLERPA